MRKIDLVIYYRKLLKNIQETLIKVFGLSIGLACILVIYLFINTELTYDRFHEDASDIYRVEREAEARGRVFKSSLVGPLVGETILNELPEIKEMTRLFTYTWREEALIEYKDKQFFEKKMFLVDPSFFKLFSFRLVQGNIENVFKQYNSVVLSESCAKKYFGEDDPIGKTITLKNFGNKVLVVSGIIKDVPQNSHFSFDLLLLLDICKDIYWDPFIKGWDGSDFYTYIKTQKNVNVEDLEQKIKSIITEKYSGKYGIPNLSLKALTSIHLYSHYSDEIEKNGNVDHVFFAFIIGLIICLISLSNFVNITNAQVIFRAKEVGVKKMLGESRAQLFIQFMIESILLAFISMIIAFIIIEVIISPFTKLLNININIYNGNIYTYVGFIMIVILFGVLAGLFPALMYSAYKTIDVLKGKLWKVGKRITTRRIIMTAQFVIVAVLLISTLVVYKQKKFLVNDDPGFSVENVIVVPLKDYSVNQNYLAFKNSLQSYPFITNVTSSSALPMSIRVNIDIECEGHSDVVKMTSLDVDFDFIELFDLEIIAGRSFNQQYSNDSKTSYIINQTAAKLLNWENPVGRTINYSNKDLKLAEFEEGKVIGVVKDFNHTSKHNKIQPLIIKVYPGLHYVSIRFTSGYHDEALEFIKSKYEEVNVDSDFSYFLAEQKFEELYQDEENMNSIFAYSTSIAIIIAILGLFSLASLDMKRKFREIGIRKVFGADASTLLIKFLKQYGLLVLISNVISFPIAWYIMNKWLNSFAYAINISIWYFVIAFLVITIIALATVVGQAFRASSKNPIDSLKYE